MTDSTNNSFEEQWQNAFDDAELTPPESVWEKIELGLKPENTLPSKHNFGNKPYYFLGGIGVGLLGAFLWFNNVEEKIQVAENHKVKIEETVLENKPNISQKVVVVVGGDTNHGAKSEVQNKSEVLQKVVEVIKKDINHVDKKNVEVVGGDTNHGAIESTIEEVPIRTLTDSVEMIEPLATKSIHSEIENPTINLPTEQTPYYVKPTLKPQKKSILKNVKISVGAGVYHQ